MQVCGWVQMLHMDSVVDCIRANNIDGPVLLTLTEKDLVADVGVEPEEAQKLLGSLQLMLNEGGAALS